MGAADTPPPTPGLEWRKRRNRLVPIWTASRKLRRLGYPVSTVSLEYLADENGEYDIAALSSKCLLLDAEQKRWANGGKDPEPDAPDQRQARELVYTGTIASLCDFFELHPESPFHEKRQSTQQFYLDNMKILRATVGQRVVAALTGLDVKRWFKNWRAPVVTIEVAEDGTETEIIGPDRLRRARSCLSTLSVVLGFGQLMMFKNCAELKLAIEGIEWESTKRREEQLEYAQAEKLIDFCLNRMAPHDLQVALSTAIQFECALRQKDLIGEWLKDRASKGAGGILFGSRRWDGGMVWGTHINSKLQLCKKTSKSNFTKEVNFDLTRLPLVMRVLAHVPEEQRIGPVIMHPGKGRPYLRRTYAALWRERARPVGIPDTVWNMDSRAGSITETLDSGASLEEARRLATHGSTTTTVIYDRNKRTETANKVADLKQVRRQRGEK